MPASVRPTGCGLVVIFPFPGHAVFARATVDLGVVVCATEGSGMVLGAGRARGADRARAAAVIGSLAAAEPIRVAAGVHAGRRDAGR